MEPTPTLQSVLTDIAARNAGEEVELEFNSKAKIDPEGVIYVPHDARDVLDADVDEDIDENSIGEFRIVRDSTAHEAHHKRLTRLGEMEAFAQRFPEAPNVATTVLNVVEDVFIDIYRLNRYPGQRIEYTYKIQQWFNGRRDEFPDEPEPEDMANGVIEIGKSGGVVGIESCSNDDVLNFFEWARDMFEIVRADSIATFNGQKENEPQLRWDIATTITRRLIEVLGNEENVNKVNENMDQAFPFPTHGNMTMMGFGMDDEPNPDGMDMDTAGGLQVAITPEDAIDQAQSGDGGDDMEFDVIIETDSDGDPWADDNVDEGDDEDVSTGSGQGLPGGDERSDDDDDNDAGGGNVDEEDDVEEDESGGESDGGNPQDGDGDKDDQSDGEEPDSSENDSSENEPNTSKSDSPGSSAHQGPDHDSGEEDTGTAPQGEDPAQSLAPDFESWVKMSSSVDPTQAPSRVEDEYVQVIENSEGNFDNIDVSKQKRDKRLQSSDGGQVKRMIVEEWGEKIEEAFKIFKTRDREQAVVRGDEPHIENYIEYRAGNKTVNKFMKTRLPTEPGERLNVVSVDMSGSINEGMVKTALGAFQYATDIIGDDFAAVSFSTNGRDGDVVTPLITAPDEPFEWGHIDTVASGGKTPTEAGIDRANDLVKKYGKRENVLIVITDGKPNMVRQSTAVKNKASATRVAHERVREAEQYAKVIGVGVGNVNEKNMRSIFGDDYVMIDESNLANELVDIYRRQMNVDDTTHI